MSEPEEVERSITGPVIFARRRRGGPHQPRLLFISLETEMLEPFRYYLRHPSGFVLVLEAQDRVISVAHHKGVLAKKGPYVLLEPSVE